MKKIWSGIRKIVNTRQSLSRFISQISTDGKDLKDPKQMVNAFSNFFVNVANTVNKDIPLTFKSPNHNFYIQLQNVKLRTLLTL